MDENTHKRQYLIEDVRKKPGKYEDLFILPIERVSNRQIEKRCYGRYKGYNHR